MQTIVLKERDIRGTIAYVNSHPAVIELVEDGIIDLAPFITGQDQPHQPQRDRCEDPRLAQWRRGLTARH